MAGSLAGSLAGSFLDGKIILIRYRSFDFFGLFWCSLPKFLIIAINFPTMIRASLSFSRRMFASQKAATGLVGLPVADDGIAELKEVSTNILQQIQVCPSNLSTAQSPLFIFRCFLFFFITFTLQGSVATRMSLRALSLMAACLCVMSRCLLSRPTATLYSPRILFVILFFIIS